MAFNVNYRFVGRKVVINLKNQTRQSVEVTPIWALGDHVIVAEVELQVVNVRLTLFHIADFEAGLVLVAGEMPKLGLRIGTRHVQRHSRHAARQGFMPLGEIRRRRGRRSIRQGLLRRRFGAVACAEQEQRKGRMHSTAGPMSRNWNLCPLPLCRLPQLKKHTV